MHFKLIVAFVEDKTTQAVLNAARLAGATGSTIISHARGEGAEKSKTFFGMNLESPRDVILLMVEEHLSRSILESIAITAGFDKKPGSGIALQIDVEDAVGIDHQVRMLAERIEGKI